MTAKVEKLSACDVFKSFDQWDNLLKISIPEINKQDPTVRGCKEKNIVKDCLYDKVAANCNHIQVVKKGTNFSELNKILRKNLSDYTGKDYIELRNFIMYGKDGYMGWHTNRNCVGMRYYLTWAEEEGKSFFKYFDGNKIVSIPDVKGWQVNKFLVTGKHGPNDYNYFLHSVESNTNRLSIGYKVK